MFVSTRLFIEISKTFLLITRFNLIPLKFPFKITQISKDADPPKYMFQSNLDFRDKYWRFNVAILLSVSVLGVYNQAFCKSTLLKTCFNGLNVFAFFFIAKITYSYHKCSADYVALLNQMLRFEEKYVLGDTGEVEYWSSNFASRMECLLTRNIVVSYIALGFAFGITGGISRRPWSILPEILFQDIRNFLPGDISHTSGMVLEILRMALVTMHQYLCWRTYVNFACLGLSVMVMVYTFAIYSSLLVFHRKLGDIRGRNSVDDFVQMYREIQTTAVVYNDIGRAYLYPGFMFIASYAFCICTYALVTRVREYDLVTNTNFVNGLCLAVAILIPCFHFAMRIFNVSNDTLDSFADRKALRFCDTSNGSRFKSNLWLRYWKSFRCIKIYISGVNFFETETQLNVLNNWIGWVVNLILMGK